MFTTNVAALHLFLPSCVRISESLETGNPSMDTYSMWLVCVRSMFQLSFSVKTVSLRKSAALARRALSVGGLRRSEFNTWHLRGWRMSGGQSCTGAILYVAFNRRSRGSTCVLWKVPSIHIQTHCTELSEHSTTDSIAELNLTWISL